uniref:Uncharacterized protein n=1 Tax=Anguilla anguilla TaxID=7936 RepID=A0A0E9SE76_ANGAN
MIDVNPSLSSYIFKNKFKNLTFPVLTFHPQITANFSHNAH